MSFECVHTFPVLPHSRSTSISFIIIKLQYLSQLPEITVPSIPTSKAQTCISHIQTEYVHYSHVQRVYVKAVHLPVYAHKSTCPVLRSPHILHCQHNFSKRRENLLDDMQANSRILNAARRQKHRCFQAVRGRRWRRGGLRWVSWGGAMSELYRHGRRRE